MESAEPKNTRLVRVLKYDFEPSEQLHETVHELFLEETAKVRNFRFHATRVALLDGQNYNHLLYHEPVTKIEDAFVRRNAPVFLSGAANTVNVNNMTRINFQVFHRDAFNKLLSGFDQLDILNPEEPRAPGEQGLQHYVYLEVPAAALLQPAEERTQAFATFKARLEKPDQKRLHYLRPLEITGFDRLIQDKEAYHAIATRVLTHKPLGTAN